MLKNLNIVIPLAGAGSRFKNVGYKKQKPLIDVFGKTMIEQAVNSLDIHGNYIFLIRGTSREKNALKATLKRIKTDCKILEVDKLTDGPACTCLLAKKLINNNNPLVIANCDQIMHWNSLDFFKGLESADGAVVTYNSDTEKNSYVKLGFPDHKGERQAIEFAEKNVISNHSLNGIHYWKKGSDFVSSAEEMIKNDDRTNNEFYIAPSYNYLIKNNKKITTYEIKQPMSHNAVGTPEDLEKYIDYQNKRMESLWGNDDHEKKLTGLKFIPDIGIEENKLDKVKGKERDKFSVRYAFSADNAEFLRETLNSRNPKTILEIGVNNSLKYDYSSTFNFLSYVSDNKDVKYLGIDIDEENIDGIFKDPGIVDGENHINNNKKLFKKNKIDFVNADSGKYNLISEKIKNFLGGKIDMFFIDGWHSIDQVLKEWRYIKFLSEDGIVILHDTNNHPGPKSLIKAIDKDVFEINEPFKGRKNDWGIASIKFRKSKK